MREPVTQQPIERLTLHIPTTLVEKARREADATRRSLNRFIVEAVERRVSPSAIAGETHAEHVKALLEAEGLLSDPPILELERCAAGSPLLSYEALWEKLKGQRPLSTDIIEMRGDL